MREWVERTVESASSAPADRALEIGCGTGMLLFRVAPLCERTSEQTSRAGRPGSTSHAGRRPRLVNVELLKRVADDFTGLDPGAFDTVVLNSVIQYFPSIDYLARVLEGALRVTARAADLHRRRPSLPLLEAFHASIELQSRRG